MNHYNRIASSLTWLAGNFHRQPSLAEIAAQANLSETHFQKVFSEWAGVSPKKFLQAVTLESARQCLDQADSVLDASLSVGLSGASRLHDLFVTVEALSPGEYKSGGLGLEISYGFHATPFGQALLMLSPRGVTSLAFVCEQSPTELLAVQQQRLPYADYFHDQAQTAGVISRIFSTSNSTATKSLPLLLAGTEFQLKVWRALLEIPSGACVTYSHLAKKVGIKNAQRAVGTAVGKNPIAVAIPCHRVIRQTGLLGGYRWGEGRKLALLGAERLDLQHLSSG